MRKTTTLEGEKMNLRFVPAALCVLVIALFAAPGTAFSQETGTDPPNSDTVDSELRADALSEADPLNGSVPPASDWREYASSGDLARYDSLAASTEEDEDRYADLSVRYAELEQESEGAGALSYESMQEISPKMDEVYAEQVALIEEHTPDYQAMVAIETEASDASYAAMDAAEEEEAAEEEAAEEEPVPSSSGGSPSGSVPESEEAVPETDTSSGGGGWSVSLFGVVFLVALVGGAYLYYSKQRALSGRPANEYIENVTRAIRQARGAAVATVAEARKPIAGSPLPKPDSKREASPTASEDDSEGAGENQPSGEADGEKRQTRHKTPTPDRGGAVVGQDVDPDDPFRSLRESGPQEVGSRGQHNSASGQTSNVREPEGLEEKESALVGGSSGAHKSVLEELGFDMTAAARRLIRTTIFIYEDGTWTREFASERGWRWSVGKEQEVPDPVEFIWSRRRAVNEFLMLCFPGSLEQRVYGVGA